MGKYIKCPRCELNWILEADEYCDVCKAELGVEGFSLLEDEEDDILCPVCGVNYIDRNKKMCAECLAKTKSNSRLFDGESDDSDIDADGDIANSETQPESEDGIEKIAFDDIDEGEKFDLYDDAFDDQDDFSSNDFAKEELDEDEEDEEEDSNEEIDDFEADFNYDIDSVEDIDDEEELDEEEDEE
jgi:hypothetical protein